jgi:hypothetical protein
MTPEEKVLAEIQEKILVLMDYLAQIKVAEDERIAFEKEKREYKILIDDYKKHKAALIRREECLK